MLTSVQLQPAPTRSRVCWWELTQPEISRHVRVRLDAAKSSSLAEIGSVPPSHSGADAHARRKKIPDVPFAQQDPVAAELRSTKKCSVVATRWAWARNIRPLKVSA